MKRCLLMLVLMVGLMVSGPRAIAQDVTLMLDWFPNVDHLPIYVAQEKNYFSEEGIQVTILSPSDTADALKLAVAGKVDLAVSYEPQTIIAAAEGLPVRVVGRLVAHPLTTLLFLKEKGYSSPVGTQRQNHWLYGTGPDGRALQAFAKINRIEDYTAVNVGFNIVPALTSGRVDAVMGPFKTYETVTMAAKGIDAAYFELEHWGIPDYDELIFICGAETLAKKSDVVQAFMRAVTRGLEDTRSRPEDALQDYFKAVPDVDQAIERAAFEQTRPYFAQTQTIDQKRWQAFADFALEHELIAKAGGCPATAGDRGLTVTSIGPLGNVGRASLADLSRKKTAVILLLRITSFNDVAFFAPGLRSWVRHGIFPDRWVQTSHLPGFVRGIPGEGCLSVPAIFSQMMAFCRLCQGECPRCPPVFSSRAASVLRPST